MGISDSVSGMTARDYTLPPRHRLTVRAAGGDVTLHRMGENAVSHNYEIREGEEWAVVSASESRWRVQPALGCATVTIESTT